MTTLTALTRSGLLTGMALGLLPLVTGCSRRSGLKAASTASVSSVDPDRRATLGDRLDVPG